MFGKKQLIATTLAAGLVALTPQFAAANDINKCTSIANSRGIHQYRTQQGTLGFQEGRGIGCEYKHIGSAWRVLDAFNLRNSRERTRFYRDWDRAQQVSERLAESNRRRNPGGLRGANNSIRDIERTIRGVDSLLRTLDRLGR